MKTLKLAVPLLAALLLLGAGSARAHDDDAGAPAEHGHMSAAKLKDKLGLSDDQVKKLDASMAALKESVKPLREQVKKDMTALKEQLKAKAKDDEIQSTLDALKKDRDAMRDAMEKHMADLKDILTPTQRAKMVVKMGERRKHFWQRRNKED